MPEPAAGSEEAARRFLTFRLDGRLYALDAAEVAEVIRIPAVARVPQAPPSLLGLANLRGAVLPVASLRALLGVAAGEAVHGAGARAIVLDGGAPVALAVDEVDAMVAIDAADIETRQATLASVAGERLSGAFQVDGRGEVAKILDVRPLLAAAFTPRARTLRTGAGAAALNVTTAEADTADAARLVTFDVAGQEYGLNLQAVQEIVAPPAALLVAPQAEAALLGVTPYRDTLLPLMSLRVLLGAADGAAPSAESKVMVVRVGGALVGLVADRMRAIVPARPELVEPAPAMLAARAGGESRIKAILRGEGGRRLIAILEPEQLFREDVMQRLGEGGPMSGQDEAEDEARETLQVLVFRLGDDEFGLPIGAVDEVARAPERVTRVPKTPAFLEGVINLRGEVLPVVDQRRRFGLAPVAAAESRRLVVVRTARHRAGLLVDAVSEVLRAHRDAVEPAPDLTGEAERLVEGVINLADAGRMVLLLDPAELLTRAERGLLDAFAAETPQAPS